MSWTFERMRNGSIVIRTETGLEVFASSLPERGESDASVTARTAFVVDAINEKLARIAAVEPVKGGE